MSQAHAFRMGTEQSISTRWAAVLLLGLASACGAPNPTEAYEASNLQAVLSVERIEHASAAEAASASAVAQFSLVPADADEELPLGAAGLHTRLPEPAGCTEFVLGDSGPRDADAFPEPIELLEAGDVEIRANDVVTRLALNVFPPSGSASGVIYTTPDRSPEPLPADADYRISASGSDAVPPITLHGRSPSVLENVTVGGVPLDQATTIVAGQPLDFTWSEGQPRDRVYVELNDERTRVLCAFADEEGNGSIPAALTAQLASDAAVRVSAHRVREAVISQEPQRLDAKVVEPIVRFDFELTSALRVQ